MVKAVSKLAMNAGLAGIALAVFMSGIAYADQTDNMINNGLKRQKAAAQSQSRIDTLSEQTDKIISKYHQQRKVVEGLKIYNDRLRRTLEAQEKAMGQLRQSIENASLIERQIVPLMTRMIAGLEQFIESDLPFKLDERRDRVARIKSYLTNANISAAERFRKVLEAYSIENNYGQAIDVYTDTLNVDNVDMTVNILQLGRSVIYYQTTDESQSGFYNASAKQWQGLDSSHNLGISRAIKVAQKKISPELMLLPIPAPEDL